jgi:hypothetical protein
MSEIKVLTIKRVKIVNYNMEQKKSILLVNGNNSELTINY